ncbi:MAG: YjbQ family protein [Candidatus Aenigmarchaeota archaeon]|nr:YjbQ family protein [Candidatus Aenigmarchaeota archaeon]
MMYKDSVKLKVKSQKIVNITGMVEDVLRKSKIKDGLCSLFSVGATCSVIINEDDPMLLEDLRKAMEKIAPEKGIYQHAENAHSHIRSAIMGSSQTIPIKDGKMQLGTWQEIMVANFDTKDREREVIVTIISD